MTADEQRHREEAADSSRQGTADPAREEGEALRAMSSSSASPSSPSPAGDAEAGQDAKQGDAAGAGEQAGEVERDLDALLAEAEGKRDEYLELARRTQADFENYRKRVANDLKAAAARGKAELARDVVPALDDLERALEAAGVDPEGEAEDGLAQGVILVFRGLRESLARNGVEVVDPRGERFDPTVHEAVSTTQVEGTESGVVVEVMQKGYRFEEHLIRPARVVVSA